ncbi:hypothetical protein HDU96_007078 [Phlyctochytrium bullatum]|nr:hypothetical protein HDU96_007078 [Phlyctochytrium bullatum]
MLLLRVILSRKPLLLGLLRYVAAALGIAPFAAIAYLHWHTRRSRVKGLKMMPPDPVVGNAMQLFRELDTRFEYNLKLSQKLGMTWVYTMPSFDGRSNVMTVDPVVVEYVLKTNFENFIKGPRFINLLHPLLGDGIFNSDSEQWRWQRKTSTLIFTGRNFRSVFVKVFSEDIAKLVQFLNLRADDGRKFDLHGVLHAFTMDTFSKLAFGVNLHGMDNPEQPTEFARAFDMIVRILLTRFFNPLWFVAEVVDGTGAELKRNLKIVETLASEYIAAKRKARESKKSSEQDEEGVALKKDLLDLFLDADGGRMTDKALRDMVLNMVLAGRDTTAQTLSWAILELMRHPEVVKNLRYEIKTVLDNEIPTFDQVFQLKYVVAFLNEVLRLYPAVPLTGKRCVKADVLPHGIHIPAGTDVGWSSWVMGRLPAIWGPDAAEFKPERWFESKDGEVGYRVLKDGTVDAMDATLKRESQFKWLAFNAGPRVCIGQQMAMVEMSMTLCALLTRFDFRPADDMKITHARAFSLQMGNGLSVHISHKQ